VADGGVFRSRLQDPADCHRLHAIDPKREKAGRSFILLPTGMQARPRRGVMIICLCLYCETRCKAESVRFGGRSGLRESSKYLGSELYVAQYTPIELVWCL
jgi:hypothetical protein